jgi:hypothetical protein
VLPLPCYPRIGTAAALGPLQLTLGRLLAPSLEVPALRRARRAGMARSYQCCVFGCQCDATVRRRWICACSGQKLVSRPLGSGNRDRNQEPGVIRDSISGELSAEEHQSVAQRIEIHARIITGAGPVGQAQLFPRLSIPRPGVVQSSGRTRSPSEYDNVRLST